MDTSVDPKDGAEMTKAKDDVIITVLVNGVKCKPINLPTLEPSSFRMASMIAYTQGHLYLESGVLTPYDINIYVGRNMTPEEKKKHGRG